MGPNVYILPFWGYQNRLEPYEKWSEDLRNAISCKKYIFGGNAFFDPKFGQNAHKMGKNGVHCRV